MATFLRKLDRLLGEAEERGVLDAPTADRLRAIAGERERRGGLLSLAGVLGWLGAAALGLGVILLISANWTAIPDAVKIAGFLVLFASVHGAGLWLRWKAPDHRRTADALHSLGALLFIAGVGLIAQIFHLDGSPPRAVLLWLMAIAPLAWLLASPGVTFLALFATTLWFHLQGALGGSLFRVIDSFSAHLIVEIGLGLGALGASAALRRVERPIAAVLSSCGALMLFGALYLLGFYRHFGRGAWNDEVAGYGWLPLAALVLGVVGLAAGWNRFAEESPGLRPRLLAVMAVLVVFSLLVLGVETRLIPAGPDLVFLDFGWEKTYTTAEWLLSFVAWGLWFLLAFGAVAFGTTSGRAAFLNLGVAGVGLGVITRFFDLVGGLAQTGFLFVAGGGVLLATAYFTERWRKRLVKTMQGGAA